LEQTLPRIPAIGKAASEIRRKCNTLILQCRNDRPAERPGINTIVARLIETLAIITFPPSKNESGIADEPPVSTEILAGLHSRLAHLFERMTTTTADNMRRAEFHYNQCLKLTQRRFGTSHAAYALALDNLAGFLVTIQRRTNEALPLFEEALNIRQENLGEHMHPAVANSLVNVAEIYLEYGRLDEAHDAYSKAFSIRERALGKNHPSVAATLCGLGAVAKEKANINEAETLYRRALSVAVNACGPEDMAVVPVLEGLADCRLEVRDYDAASKLYGRVAKIANTHGVMATYAAALNRRAVISQLQARHSEAEQFYKRALTVRIHSLGTTHIDTAQSLYNLAVFIFDTPKATVTKINEAKKLLKHALLIIDNQLGSDHPMTLRVRDTMNRIDAPLSPASNRSGHTTTSSTSIPVSPARSVPGYGYAESLNTPTEIPTILF